jgi:hypothetical protein
MTPPTSSEYPPSYYAATANEQTAYPQLQGSVAGMLYYGVRDRL